MLARHSTRQQHTLQTEMSRIALTPSCCRLLVLKTVLCSCLLSVPSPNRNVCEVLKPQPLVESQHLTPGPREEAWPSPVPVLLRGLQQSIAGVSGIARKRALIPFGKSTLSDFCITNIKLLGCAGPQMSATDTHPPPFDPSSCPRSKADPKPNPKAQTLSLQHVTCATCGVTAPTHSVLFPGSASCRPLSQDALSSWDYAHHFNLPKAQRPGEPTSCVLAME